MKRFASAFLLAALTILPLSAQGQPGGKPGGPGHGDPMDMYKGLGISDAKLKELKAVHEKHKPAFEAKFKAAGEARKAVKDAEAKKAPEAELKALQEKLSQARAAIGAEMESVKQETDKILTPEQKAELEKRFANMPKGPHGPDHKK